MHLRQEVFERASNGEQTWINRNPLHRLPQYCSCIISITLSAFPPGNATSLVLVEEKAVIKASKRSINHL